MTPLIQIYSTKIVPNNSPNPTPQCQVPKDSIFWDTANKTEFCSILIFIFPHTLPKTPPYYKTPFFSVPFHRVGGMKKGGRNLNLNNDVYDWYYKFKTILWVFQISTSTTANPASRPKRTVAQKGRASTDTSAPTPPSTKHSCAKLSQN